MKKIWIILFFALLGMNLPAQEANLKLALLKYNGGGDWYANPTSLPNLMRFCNEQLKTNFTQENAVVEPGSIEIFNYPLVHITGHGNVIFSAAECRNLRLYLESGGFLHIDDNYGIDPYIRREMKKIFPDQEFAELPASHPIFHQKFDFPSGIPKIHEHDGKRPQAFGLFINERLVCLYTAETDLGDGWEDSDVHSDGPEIREKALEMGANIVSWVFSN